MASGMTYATSPDAWAAYYKEVASKRAAYAMLGPPETLWTLTIVWATPRWSSKATTPVSSPAIPCHHHNVATTGASESPALH